MDWIALAGAVGAGALLGKLIDVTWLERQVRQREQRQWLRDQRFKAYSALARELRTSGLRNADDPFPAQNITVLAADVELLTDNDKINSQLRDMANVVMAIGLAFEMGQLSDETREDQLLRIGGLVNDLSERSDLVIKELRGHLLD